MQSLQLVTECDYSPGMSPRRLGLLAIIGPGILVAATGVGAGDIAGAGFAGSYLGYTILWAAVVGAFTKFVVNEGLMRWQLATGQTLLEGAVHHFGRVVQWLFLVYLLIWSFGVGSALISAAGVAGSALFPLFDDPQTGRVVFGIAHSVIAVVLIIVGGYQRFEKLMMGLLLLMFVSVVATAVLSNPDWSAVAAGLFVPRIPTEAGGDGLRWTIALMGGVGGTVTMLCYGYWIREQGRTGPEFLRICRIDLLVSYTVTAIFGISMVIIATGMTLGEAGGTRLMVLLSERLGETLGRPVGFVFLVGGWAAIFTSMLGVWQAVPYLFCDFWGLLRRRRSPGNADELRVAVDTRFWIYRGYLIALAIVPIIGLQYRFDRVQQAYSMLGALILPLTALALLILNGRTDWVGRQYRNRPLTVVVLVGVLIFFAYAIYLGIRLGLREPLIS